MDWPERSKLPARLRKSRFFIRLVIDGLYQSDSHSSSLRGGANARQMDCCMFRASPLYLNSSRARFVCYPIWSLTPELSKLTGPICARALKYRHTFTLDASGHHDWPVMSATRRISRQRIESILISRPVPINLHILRSATAKFAVRLLSQNLVSFLDGMLGM